MVLGMSMLITVIGLGALATQRVTTRAANAATDWQESGVLAFSAVEHAVAKLGADAVAAPTTWRDAYSSGAVAFSTNFGRGTMKWVLVDEDDGLLNDDYCDTMKLYGVGMVGSTKRVYSVQLGTGGGGIDALRTAFHAAGGVALNGPTVVVGGPVSTNGNLTNAANQRGSAGNEVAGAGGTSSPAKQMPGATAFDTYKSRSTTIGTFVAAGGTMQPGTLSAADNPYGDENADGIYYIRLPDTISTLTISASHISGTLLVEAAAGSMNQTVVIDGPLLWEPSRASLASMITKGIRTIWVNGSITPYDGGPSELRGLFHTIDSTDVQFNNATFLKGCWIADGTITTSGAVGVTATPSLLTTVPLGYSKGTLITPVAGSWKWDAPPNGIN